LETKYAAIGMIAVAVIILALVLAFNFLTLPRLKSGHTEIEGFLELRPYPKISEAVPTVMVYILVPMYNQDEIYLTENGLPLSSVENFTQNQLVRIEGILYNRDAVDGSKTYWMIEVFNISEGD
jgi:hypothetical protein